MTVWVTAPWPGPLYCPHPAGSIRRDKKGKRRRDRETGVQGDRQGDGRQAGRWETDRETETGMETGDKQGDVRQ